MIDKKVNARLLLSTLEFGLEPSGAAVSRAVVHGILARAQGQGVDQATLARRAGISAESLSRLKRQGSCRLSTALDLARAAGLGVLRLVPGPRSPAAAALAARKLSAGRPRTVTAAELVNALAAGRVEAALEPHLYGLFEELPIETVHDLCLDEGLDYRTLLELARSLGAEGETVEWLAEMAGDGLAKPA